jgi:hypothetical protein
MGRIGIAISGGANPTEIIDLVVLAESLGYESAWIAEGHGGDQFAILAACATRTSHILLATSISSVFVRTAPTIAMAASTVAEISGGRFILGLGSSHKVQVEPEHGVAYGRPLTRTREPCPGHYARPRWCERNLSRPLIKSDATRPKSKSHHCCRLRSAMRATQRLPHCGRASPSTPGSFRDIIG